MTAKTLVVRHGALGDLAKFAPFLYSLKQRQPITLLTDPAYAELMQWFDLADAVITDPRDKFGFSPKFFKKASVLRKLVNDFDVVIDLQSTSRTHLYSKIAQRPVWKHLHKHVLHKRRFSVGKEIEELPFHNGSAAKEEELCAADLLEKTTFPTVLKNLKGFDSKKPYIVLVLDVSRTRPEKSWPLEHFIELTKLLLKENYQIVCCAQDALNMSTVSSKIFDLTGKTSLPQLMDVLAYSSLVIGADTGSLHWAALFGRPTISLFSEESDPRKHAPVSKVAQVIQSSKMAGIKPQEVLKRALKIIETETA